MEFASRDQIGGVAELHEAGRGLQTRAERLARWAEVLKRDPDRTLRSLGEIEFVPEEEREALRVDGSPLTVAFEDPLLRVAVLRAIGTATPSASSSYPSAKPTGSSARA